MPSRRIIGDPGAVERHNRTMLAVERMGESITERVEELFNAMDSRLERIESRVTAGEKGRDSILSEMGELRRDQGELRDLVTMGQGNAHSEIDHQVVERAALQVSRQATAAIVPAMEKAAKKSPLARSRLLWVAAISGAFTGTIVAIEHVPETIRGVGHLLALIAGWKR